jgi:hypothetical protein
MARAPAFVAHVSRALHERRGHVTPTVCGRHNQLFGVAIEARPVIAPLALVVLEHRVDEADHRAIHHGDEHAAVDIPDP